MELGDGGPKSPGQDASNGRPDRPGPEGQDSHEDHEGRDTQESEFRQQLPLPGKRRLERIAVSGNSSKGSAYQGAVEAVFAIVIATLLGYWADEYFDTAPRWLITGAVVGFASFVLRLMRMRELVENTEPETRPEAKIRREPDTGSGAAEKEDENEKP